MPPPCPLFAGLLLQFLYCAVVPLSPGLSVWGHCGADAAKTLICRCSVVLLVVAHCNAVLLCVAAVQ